MPESDVTRGNQQPPHVDYDTLDEAKAGAAAPRPGWTVRQEITNLASGQTVCFCVDGGAWVSTKYGSTVA